MFDPIEEIGKDIRYGKSEKKKIKRKNTSFTQQEVDLQKTPFLLFPPGKEMLFLGIYFVTIPYIVGLVFIFFYVSNGNATAFGSLNTDSNFFLIWALGYEIVAVFVLLMIVKSAIRFSINNAQASVRRKPPRKRYR
ncbi:hypothetical protein MNB_SV-4-278 [hydrothermal vent metagenome]|uniref:Uncharacterized protein n=1 Tax=hydrothermal vent metagenome TaxID=652676 RepID=A0A1W1E8A1_9ZZZZ